MKKNKKQKKNSNKIKITTYLLVLIDTIAIICLLITYGPFSFARDWFVTTAMGTGHHRYLAQIFYSNEAIIKIMDNNKIVAVDEDTNVDAIKIGDFDTSGNYASIYEQQILERDSEDQAYKLIRIDENQYKGYLVAIYDPSRVSLYTAKDIKRGGDFGTDMAKDSGAKVLINGSAFSRINGGLVPHGTTIKDGKILSKGATRSWGGIIGLTNDNVLVLCKDTPANLNTYNFRDAVYFGPFLVINGKPSYTTGQAGGLQPRTAIGQRKDGIILFLVIDGRSTSNGNGASYADLTKIFVRYGAYNAANLDGGGSSTLVVEGKLTNNPCGYGSCSPGYTQRYIPNAFIFE